MSFTDKALKSDKVKLALADGVIKLIQTGDLQKGIDEVFKAGKKNGALDEVQAGFILDLLMEIQRNWKPTGKRINLETLSQNNR